MPSSLSDIRSTTNIKSSHSYFCSEGKIITYMLVTRDEASGLIAAFVSGSKD